MPEMGMDNEDGQLRRLTYCSLFTRGNSLAGHRREIYPNLVYYLSSRRPITQGEKPTAESGDEQVSEGLFRYKDKAPAPFFRNTTHSIQLLHVLRFFELRVLQPSTNTCLPVNDPQPCHSTNFLDSMTPTR